MRLLVSGMIVRNGILKSTYQNFFLKACGGGFAPFPETTSSISAA